MEENNALRQSLAVLARHLEVDEAGLPHPAAGPTLDDVRRFLTAHVARLLDRNPALLMSILYRIDVPERLVQQALRDAPPAELASRLADLMIDRQLQKLHLRRAYRADP